MKPQDEHIIITASIHSHTGAYRAPNVPYVHCEAPSFEPDDSQDGEVFMVGALGALGNRQHVENITSQIPTTGKVVQVVAGSDFSLFLCEEE
mmetsp:Transcript_2484/g.9351  ORF Transcript_2484/g.9351 Transcript_2484/m.9351 type:complete len:92 (+) Transcript_2484:4513-4788(+)